MDDIHILIEPPETIIVEVQPVETVGQQAEFPDLLTFYNLAKI